MKTEEKAYQRFVSLIFSFTLIWSLVLLSLGFFRQSLWVIIHDTFLIICVSYFPCKGFSLICCKICMKCPFDINISLRCPHQQSWRKWSINCLSDICSTRIHKTHGNECCRVNAVAMRGRNFFRLSCFRKRGFLLPVKLPKQGVQEGPPI